MTMGCGLFSSAPSAASGAGPKPLARPTAPRAGETTTRGVNLHHSTEEEIEVGHVSAYVPIREPQLHYIQPHHLRRTTFKTTDSSEMFVLEPVPSTPQSVVFNEIFDIIADRERELAEIKSEA